MNSFSQRGLWPECWKGAKKWVLYQFGCYCQGQLKVGFYWPEIGTNFWLVTVKSQKVQFSRKCQGDIGPDMGLYPDRRNLWWLIWNGYYESHFLKKLILATEFKNRIFMKVNCTQWYSAIKNNCKIKLGCKIAFWGLFESTLYQGFSGK